MSFVESVAAVVFGILWTIIAFSITVNSPFGLFGAIFPLFGIVFITVGVIQAVYNYRNATGKDRYSMYDITDSSEEGDPSAKWIKDELEHQDKKERRHYETKDFNFCPYCGTRLDSGYAYCPKCGEAVKSLHNLRFTVILGRFYEYYLEGKNEFF